MREDDVALTLVHTADWHLGMRFRGFSDEQELELMRARLDVVEQIFGVADRHRAITIRFCPTRSGTRRGPSGESFLYTST
jgi:hypothetical protein